MVIVMVSKIAGIAPIGAVTFFQENDRTYGMLKRRKACGFQSALQKALRREAQKGEAAREETHRVSSLSPLR